MDCFRLYILGCGSALPTVRHCPTAQVLDVRGKCFLIDCGEGTQLQIRRAGINFNKITDVFISHLHGDHCFGLIGLISTMSLLGRTAPLRIHANPDLERVMKPQLDYFCRDLTFDVEFFSVDPNVSALVYEDRTVEVWSLPLKHRVPCNGYLFREKGRLPHIRKDMIDAYHIPLKSIPAIKEGADYITEDGEVIPNSNLTTPSKPAVSYAYCSDTQYLQSLVDVIKGVTVLYHEATFAEAEKELAVSTHHSTARQAADIASRAGVGKLLLGHYSARYTDTKILLDEALSVFPSAVLTREGMTIDII